MFLPARLIILLGITFAIIVAGVYVVILLRRKLIGSEDELDGEDAGALTTAQVESLKAQGLITEEKYVQLKAAALEAAKRRALAAHKPRAKKSGLLD